MKENYNFTIRGDLNQMSTQMRFLDGMGISTKLMNVYPIIKECDIEKALKLIWKNRVSGWWHYEEEYIELGICDKETFRSRL